MTKRSSFNQKYRQSTLNRMNRKNLIYLIEIILLVFERDVLSSSIKVMTKKEKALLIRTHFNNNL